MMDWGRCRVGTSLSVNSLVFWASLVRTTSAPLTPLQLDSVALAARPDYLNDRAESDNEAFYAFYYEETVVGSGGRYQMQLHKIPLELNTDAVW